MFVRFVYLSRTYSGWEQQVQLTEVAPVAFVYRGPCNKNSDLNLHGAQLYTRPSTGQRLDPHYLQGRHVRRVQQLNSPSKIVRRDCAVCKQEATESFYKRLTPVGNFDLYDCILSNWTDAPGNVFNKNFELYTAILTTLPVSVSRAIVVRGAHRRTSGTRGAAEAESPTFASPSPSPPDRHLSPRRRPHQSRRTPARPCVPGMPIPRRLVSRAVRGPGSLDRRQGADCYRQSV